MQNIYLEFELFLDPPITETAAMKEFLEKEKIPFWNNNTNANPKYKINKAIAQQFIADGLQQLSEMAKSARDEKWDILTAKAKATKEVGVTEANQNRLVNEFKKFFKEETIRNLVPLDSSAAADADGFIVPNCPASLQYKSPLPSYADMKQISDDLKVVGKKDLYDLLGVNKERASTGDIYTKAVAEEKRIHAMPKKDWKSDVFNRLAGRFMHYFKNDDQRRSYDVALKRFPFDDLVDKKLNIYADSFLNKKKTDYKKFFELIGEVKQIGFTQEEASWLVYEYFCITKKCPLPEKSKKGVGWGKHEKLHSQLVYLFNESIEYHKSNPRIKKHLQSVIEQFNNITDPDSVASTVKKIINEDLRKFWDSCKEDGITPLPLFKPTSLANYPKLKDFLQYFMD